MNFTSAEIPAILQRRRTQVRRLVDNRAPHYAHRRPTVRGGSQSRYLIRPFRPVVGETVTLTKARRKDGRLETETLGKLLILAADTQTLGTVSFQEARAEGHRTTTAFRADWVQRHDLSWLAKHQDAEDDLLLERFDTRWAARMVWAITFQLDTDEPARFLADRNATTDYVDSPARALDGEKDGAVTGADLEKMAKENHARMQIIRGEQGLRETARTLSKRLNDEIRRNGKAGVDLTMRLAAIQAELDGMAQDREQAA